MGPEKTKSTPPVTVMQSFPRVGKQRNPYLTQLVTSLPDDVRTIYWSWSKAILGRYDIAHLHWPEALIRRPQRLKRAARQSLFVLFLIRVSISQVKIVRTVHNSEPHELGGALEKLLLRWCDRQVHKWILLNPAARRADGERTIVIPHGHYRDHYQGTHVPPPVEGRILYFGLIRPYKGVRELISTFSELDDSHLSLHIVGRPQDDVLRTDIQASAGGDARVYLRLDYVDDAALAREIGESELVVLPYTAMDNSGALLLALSLNRPVLVPRSPVTLALAAEVGPGWVHTFPKSLDPSAISDAAKSAAVLDRTRQPNLNAREWPKLGIQLREVYVRVSRQ